MDGLHSGLRWTFLFYSYWIILSVAHMKYVFICRTKGSNEYKSSCHGSMCYLPLEFLFDSRVENEVDINSSCPRTLWLYSWTVHCWLFYNIINLSFQRCFLSLLDSSQQYLKPKLAIVIHWKCKSTVLSAMIIFRISYKTCILFLLICQWFCTDRSLFLLFF